MIFYGSCHAIFSIVSIFLEEIYLERLEDEHWRTKRFRELASVRLLPEDKVEKRLRAGQADTTGGL